jgi:hypothetical protein
LTTKLAKQGLYSAAAKALLRSRDTPAQTKGLCKVGHTKRVSIILNTLSGGSTNMQFLALNVSAVASTPVSTQMFTQTELIIAVVSGIVGALAYAGVEAFLRIT